MKNRKQKYLKFLGLPDDHEIPMKELARQASIALGWGEHGHRSSVGVAVKIALDKGLAPKAVAEKLQDKHPWLRPTKLSFLPKQTMMSDSKRDEFYASWEWKRLRYDFLKDKHRRCCCCGRSPADGAAVNVDHIKPIRHHWHLRLDYNNLQILCSDCNMGKGSRDETNWSGTRANS